MKSVFLTSLALGLLIFVSACGPSTGEITKQPPPLKRGNGPLPADAREQVPPGVEIDDDQALSELPPEAYFAVTKKLDISYELLSRGVQQNEAYAYFQKGKQVSEAEISKGDKRKHPKYCFVVIDLNLVKESEKKNHRKLELNAKLRRGFTEKKLEGAGTTAVVRFVLPEEAPIKQLVCEKMSAKQLKSEVFGGKIRVEVPAAKPQAP